MTEPGIIYGVGEHWVNAVISSINVVGAALSDVAIPPTLLQYKNSQTVSYYDADRTLTIADRNIGGLVWNHRKLDSSAKWDSHNYIGLGFDKSGQLHVAGNMHASPLQYWIIDLSNEEIRLAKVNALLDPQAELRITYPRFIRSSDGSLIFTYRNGSSGDGDFVVVIWDDSERRNKRVSEGPLIDGGGKRNAYLDSNAPILGPDGLWHLLWVWRDSPDAESTHSINYACSHDLVAWRSGHGRPLNRPIALNNQSLVDPVSPSHGLTNNNVRLGFMPDHRPVALYHKRDGSGSQQLWSAVFEDSSCVIRQLMNWNFAWDVNGQGSLDFKIEIGVPLTTTRGLSVDVRLNEEVQAYLFDTNLLLVSTEPAVPGGPLSRSRRSDGLIDRCEAARGWSPEDDSRVWFISYASVPGQRDQRPNEVPTSHPLSIIGTSGS
ncbi:BNR repeat-containing protein [Paeniglutamicibacter sulfureus]|uniref:BNR repeat-containing protein n=1 Tax=Paeniglutamicibacter sulfureus TaxID=43666 RepID=UPI002664FEF9|nr:BNR repeat-containing protein [Paeniglutamicibacter sulfureus]MDO2935974.1 BNR repeat-containing protein [Paeniglutamicibacter sulfureus]